MTDVHRIVRYFEPLGFYARNPGLLLLLVKHRKATRQQAFRLIWILVKRGKVRMFEKHLNFRVPQEKMAHHDLRYYFKWLFPGYVPEIEPLNAGQLALLNAAPTVIAIDHSRSEFAFCAALNAANVKYALISHDKLEPSELAVYGFQKPLPIIHRWKNPYMHARDALRAGAAVMGYVDIIENGIEIVRPALFKFSIACKAQLLFGRIDLEPEGQMKCVFKRSEVNDRPSMSIDEVLKEFRAYVRPEA